MKENNKSLQVAETTRRVKHESWFFKEDNKILDYYVPIIAIVISIIAIFITLI